jgi:hypothetical protein
MSVIRYYLSIINSIYTYLIEAINVINIYLVQICKDTWENIEMCDNQLVFEVYVIDNYVYIYFLFFLFSAIILVT